MMWYKEARHTGIIRVIFIDREFTTHGRGGVFKDFSHVWGQKIMYYKWGGYS
jgi:hypothetical protein